MLFLNREEGQGLVEYALLLILVVIVIIAIIEVLSWLGLDLYEIINKYLTNGVFAS